MNSGNTIITFRQTEHSESFKEHALKELKRLDKFIPQDRTPITIELIIQGNAARNLHHIELRVKTPRFFFTSHDEGYDVYLAIEHAIDKMVTEMRKEKEKVIDSREVDWREIK